MAQRYSILVHARAVTAMLPGKPSRNGALMTMNAFLNLVGFTRHKMPNREKWLSTLGGFLGIFGILTISLWFLDPEVSVLVVPSMGASAVLLFAAPHAPFAQPWNLIVGHAISAVIGVACWQLIPDFILAASASVGLAIGAMALTQSIHPPGGATALAAVIGSEKLHLLGYAYEYSPILLNAFTILLVAVLFNNLFKWRRYPSHLLANQTEPEPVAANPVTSPVTSPDAEHPYKPIRHEDFVYALSHIDTFVDIAEEDLVEIYKLATQRSVDTDPHQ